MSKFKYPSGSTPLDPDETEGLKLLHISTREELNRFEHDNISEALQWLSIRRKGDVLTEKFMKKLHQKMFGKVWKWAGTFRKSVKTRDGAQLFFNYPLPRQAGPSFGYK